VFLLNLHPSFVGSGVVTEDHLPTPAGYSAKENQLKIMRRFSGDLPNIMRRFFFVERSRHDSVSISVSSFQRFTSRFQRLRLCFQRFR
jgi:hypothetical protein